ncbi:bifunctional 4-hydroxy-2-oxoglutarate aldolase/2-dehydro-3-deoxy-phosphogluconate aldolase [Kiloniella sp. EL199]|uniref:bifunctional 4-hydroxy-2-oxoglutarate aldolase/2-dehydro-3-deoxy-phosphogluconate aldolase n=1 Tax=Kiloniella sp. EL199 TaxID=2107581 RepID=UPI0020B144AD|nr:bifunctional 4-hydroxy-2-oxoglutarate aldolase/2-dehydro-3-deoxy-phosphogluconate aldolase [Kiloniella sp. EL199]
MAMIDKKHQSFLSKTLEQAIILPVLVIERVEDAIPLAEALLAGGCNSVEVTLRSDAALAAMEKIAINLPELTLGAGTLLECEQFQQVKDAGASYALSPGATKKLAQAAIDADFAYVPAAATPSEILELRELGYKIQKLFPAGASGGIEMLKSLSSPIADVRFCPTGGVSTENVQDYLKQPNVICVGGSWLAPKNLITEKNWAAITQIAQKSMTTVR